MRRRAHRKSRAGCVECKRRHVKCDEGRPACVNCRTVERHCSYAALHSSSTPSPSHRSSPATSTLRPSSTPSSASSLAPSSAPSLTPSVINNTASQESFPQHPISQNGLNMLHLELLFHICSGDSLIFNTETYELPIKAIIQAAFRAPYLMHQLLAISALHFSILRPAQKHFYENEAAELQTRALSLFNLTEEDVTVDNCLPMFVFSSMLGLHVFFTKVASHNNDFDTLLENFVDYLQLQRGVRVITSRSWEYLLTSELKPILEMSISRNSGSGGDKGQCDSLRSLIGSTDLSQKAMETYQKAIEHLQLAFNTSNPSRGMDMVFAWPTLISAEYVELLKQRRPEALAILAHYAALLHSHCDLWVIGNAGRYLIESINKCLGAYWENWLAWPNTVLNTVTLPPAS